MINLTYEQLNGFEFNQALNLLAAQQKLQVTASYNIARIVRQVKKTLATAQKTYQEWSTEFYEKDEKGNPIADEANPLNFRIKEESKEFFQAKMKSFLATNVAIESHPIKIEDLQGLTMSPQQMIALEPILVDGFFDSQTPL